MEWRTYLHDRRCGACGQTIKAGQWAGTFANGRLDRCVTCTQTMVDSRPPTRPDAVQGNVVASNTDQDGWQRVDAEVSDMRRRLAAALERGGRG
jgi:hypothetical protein